MAFGGRMDGCGSFMKFCLFIINFIIFLGGLAIVILAIWSVVSKSFANKLLGTDLYPGAIYVLLATGIFISLLSCFGCFGAVKEVRCMLMTYFIAVFIIFVAMLIGGILGFIFREKAKDSIRTAMQSSLSSYQRDEAITEAWDETQKTLECCGIYGPSDWRSVIPNSCCKELIPGKRPNCQVEFGQQNSFTMYQRGCYNVTVEFIKHHATIIGGAGIGVACLMVLGMVFSISLFKLID